MVTNRWKGLCHLTENLLHLFEFFKWIRFKMQGNLYFPQTASLDKPLLGLPVNGCSVVSGTPNKETEEVCNDLP